MEDEKMENKEKGLEFFSDPKLVKKCGYSAVVRFQLLFCGGFLGLLLILKLAAPQVFVNISAYIEHIILC